MLLSNLVRFVSSNIQCLVHSGSALQNHPRNGSIMYPHTREKNSCTRLLSTPRVMSERLSQVHAVLQLSRDGASWKLTIEDQLKQWIC
jgi:hypothetical protein